MDTICYAICYINYSSNDYMASYLVYISRVFFLLVLYRCQKSVIRVRITGKCEYLLKRMMIDIRDSHSALILKSVPIADTHI